MKHRNGACGKCAHYRAFYTRGYVMFMKENVGSCVERQTVVDEKNRCPLYSPASRLPTELVRAVDCALDDVEELGKIMAIQRERTQTRTR